MSESQQPPTPRRRVKLNIIREVDDSFGLHKLPKDQREKAIQRSPKLQADREKAKRIKAEMQRRGAFKKDH